MKSLCFLILIVEENHARRPDAARRRVLPVAVGRRAHERYRVLPAFTGTGALPCDRGRGHLPGAPAMNENPSKCGRAACCAIVDVAAGGALERCPAARPERGRRGAPRSSLCRGGRVLSLRLCVAGAVAVLRSLVRRGSALALTAHVGLTARRSPPSFVDTSDRGPRSRMPGLCCGSFFLTWTALVTDSALRSPDSFDDLLALFPWDTRRTIE